MLAIDCLPTLTVKLIMPMVSSINMQIAQSPYRSILSLGTSSNAAVG